MRVGYASSDITPGAPVTLSGFASRRNQLCSSVSDPLSVRALVAECDGEWVGVVSFDLLGLGPDITEAIYDRLDTISTFPACRDGVIFTCTHTHSAPATIRLIGCGIEEPRYADAVVDATADAISRAAASVRTATMRYAICTMPGANYNRRRVLSNGRVSMSFAPALPIAKKGPEWDRMTVVRFDDEQGCGIAGIVHWAGHACTVGENAVSADYPGELTRRLSQMHGVEYAYFQGACGNLNPPFGKMTRQDMLNNVSEMVNRIGDLRWSDPVRPAPFNLLQDKLHLSCGPMPTPDEVAAFGEGMRDIARTGTGPENLITVLADIINVEPGDTPEEGMLRHVAGALAEWSDCIRTEQDATCPLAVAVWRIGPLVWCFVAAEVFAETAIALQDSFPDLIVNTVGYGAPLVGYLPTDEALSEGGYEVDYAYRFYGHPAPFAKGSEAALVQWMRNAIRGG